MPVGKYTQSDLSARLPAERAHILSVLTSWAKTQNTGATAPSLDLLPGVETLPSAGTMITPADLELLADRVIAEMRRFIWNAA